MIKRANRVDESAEKVMQSLRGKSFESVFKMEVDRESGAISYRIKGSGVTGQPKDARLTNAVALALASQGVTFKSESMGSAANRDSYHLSAQFEDGGLEAKTGNYWCAPRGARIYGANAVNWVAQLLGLRPQKREIVEPPTAGDLLA